MKLKNVLIVVKDIEVSKSFYRDLFGLQVLTDFGKNVILTEGLVLQEQSLWEAGLDKRVTFGGHAMELYFEEYDLDSFVKRLGKSAYEIQYITPLTEQGYAKRVVRFYDPDMHVIEVGEVER